MPIPNLHRGQRNWQSINIESRIGPRAGKRANINQGGDLRITQHSEEFIEIAIGMSNGDERCRHYSIFVSAASL
ncbi:hypothetical protein EBBID32_13840 [Sphingobium indicum BiD32]|uniref:Uncharacterized protein n=1 Tax=Sphingobium indicum BiD32 TaxID=1301087 RepID=N1MII5_9SPHN|nr:hypothetical protein EBBID32_13840 [Sphingobium indicum BiD32]